jgi:hypothetical protein
MDWAYSVAKIPFSFALELYPAQGSGEGFMASASQIQPVGKELLAGISAAVNAIRQKCASGLCTVTSRTSVSSTNVARTPRRKRRPHGDSNKPRGSKRPATRSRKKGKLSTGKNGGEVAAQHGEELLNDDMTEPLDLVLGVAPNLDFE